MGPSWISDRETKDYRDKYGWKGVVQWLLVFKADTQEQAATERQVIVAFVAAR